MDGLASRPDRWRAMRMDRIKPHTPTHPPRPGSAVLAWPASTVARFAPGGSTVEYHTETTCRLTLGTWSYRR
ncbi:hypothetical protein Nocox_21790 [Nonomuraea coxensis DSM 45129]|uniref:Uncharacterized protein n=1 Tax=Nonomuraea coxensis DSM 45129 TaxID=1122611 RepID=A0ABX8U2K0_9ACTN|nr:hypothetical protein Nocox_21790 [Nonomuraea coxensis DSM 45129]